MEFHILELPKFSKSAEELTDGLDIWLYFLRHADKMDTEALPSTLRQPLVIRALEELKMLNQTDVERERYESRRKAQLDINTGLKVARMEGEQIGLVKGRGKELLSKIHLCEQLLKLQPTPGEHLAKLSLDDLISLADSLQEKVLASR